MGCCLRCDIVNLLLQEKRMNSLLSPFFLRRKFSPLSSKLQKSVDAFIIYEMISLADNICLEFLDCFQPRLFSVIIYIFSPARPTNETINCFYF